jgi:hypothetical protein
MKMGVQVDHSIPIKSALRKLLLGEKLILGNLSLMELGTNSSNLLPSVHNIFWDIMPVSKLPQGKR